MVAISGILITALQYRGSAVHRPPARCLLPAQPSAQGMATQGPSQRYQTMPLYCRTTEISSNQPASSLAPDKAEATEVQTIEMQDPLKYSVIVSVIVLSIGQPFSARGLYLEPPHLPSPHLPSDSDLAPHLPYHLPSDSDLAPHLPSPHLPSPHLPSADFSA